jgi:L-ascorbate metabolism protein UlaG (beta-lactamase superfamily)
MRSGKGLLWISGDTVLFRGVRDLAARLTVDTAVLHLGAVRFPVTGPVRYFMNAREAVAVCRLVNPRIAVPVHYEGWTHFRQGRDRIEQALARAPDVRNRVRWLPPGEVVDLAGEPDGRRTRPVPHVTAGCRSSSSTTYRRGGRTRRQPC